MTWDYHLAVLNAQPDQPDQIDYMLEDMRARSEHADQWHYRMVALGRDQICQWEHVSAETCLVFVRDERDARYARRLAAKVRSRTGSREKCYLVVHLDKSLYERCMTPDYWLDVPETLLLLRMLHDEGFWRIALVKSGIMGHALRLTEYFMEQRRSLRARSSIEAEFERFKASLQLAEWRALRRHIRRR